MGSTSKEALRPSLNLKDGREGFSYQRGVQCPKNEAKRHNPYSFQAVALSSLHVFEQRFLHQLRPGHGLKIKRPFITRLLNIHNSKPADLPQNTFNYFISCTAISKWLQRGRERKIFTGNNNFQSMDFGICEWRKNLMSPPRRKKIDMLKCPGYF